MVFGVPESTILFFRTTLLDWYTRSHRPLPWKGITDPYLIWLSEIILQQTRVEQGRPYFERFQAVYPDVHALAAAPEDDIMKMWEGLGYYSRARNMHATAKYIADELGGQFPNTYAQIQALRGVGPYTAAAIASFAFDLPHAVLDGNVFRVLARFLGIDVPTDSTKGKKIFQSLAQEALDSLQPGRYNQAIMDFGATLCMPQQPRCSVCPLQVQCVAYQQDRIDQLPVKSKSLKKKIRYFHYLVVQTDTQTLLHKRTNKDIWQNLHEFPLIELTSATPDWQTLSSMPLWTQLFGTTEVQLTGQRHFKQVLTHQIIHATFWEIAAPDSVLAHQTDFVVTDRKNLRKFAFPKIIDWYLQDDSLYLNLL
jgi:A/G-specific adenine glycosylase